MTLNQIEVFQQEKTLDGSQSCGYHAFKNSILTLMFYQGLINASKYGSMLKDPSLFSEIFKKTRRTQVDGTIDLSVPLFIEMINKIKNGGYDFSKCGMTPANLKTLNLDLGRSTNLSVTSYLLYPDSPKHGLSGTEDDLFVAATAFKLARNKGEGHHVFAVGMVEPFINIAHWVTTGYTQDASGNRIWSHMDSYGNQRIYHDTVRIRVEEVLNKNEEELKNYLLEAYNNSSADLYLKYDYCFDEDGNPKPEAIAKLISDKTSMMHYVEWINNRFIFMQTVGWLEPPINDEERQLITKLYTLTEFIYEQAVTAIETPGKDIERIAQAATQAANKASALARQAEIDVPEEIAAVVKEAIDNADIAKMYASIDLDKALSTNLKVCELLRSAYEALGTALGKPPAPPSSLSSPPLSELEKLEISVNLLKAKAAATEAEVAVAKAKIARSKESVLQGIANNELREAQKNLEEKRIEGKRDVIQYLKRTAHEKKQAAEPKKIRDQALSEEKSALEILHQAEAAKNAADAKVNASSSLLVVALSSKGATPTSSPKPDSIQKQIDAAINAVAQGQPKPTEGFVATMVNAIKWIWTSIKSIGERIYRAIAPLVS